MKVLTNYIYNIAIYYTDEKRVYEINNGIYKLDDYPFKELINSVCKNPVSLKKAPLSKIKDQINNDRILNVVSIVKPIPMDGSMPDAYAVVNIEEGYFRSIINSLVEKDGMEIYIANKDGEIITSNNQSRKYAQLINTNYLNSFDSKKPGYRIDSFNGEKVLLSVVTSKAYEWKYVSVIPYSSVVSKVQFIKGYSLVVSLLAVIIGLVLSLLLSNKISGPINSIAELLKSSGGKGDDRDIFGYIERNINTLVEKNVTFEKNISDHMPVLRNNYVTNILMGYEPGTQELINRLEYYGVDFNVNALHIVCIIPLDNYRKLSSRYSEQQINMLTVYLIEVLDQFVNSGNKGLVINTRPDEIAIILEIPGNEDINGVRRMVETLGSEMQKTILNNIKYTAAVGIGGICTDFSRISDSYDEALHALNYRILMGNSSIIFYEDIRNMQDENFNYPFKMEKELLEALSDGDGAVVLEKSREIFKHFISSSSEIGDIFYYYMQLLNATIKCSFELGVNVETVSQENNLYKEILKCNGVSEVQKWFEGVFISICEVVESRKSKKTHSMVQDLEEYIKKNYEKDLSLNALAEQMLMSVAYMRKLFKEDTGKSIKQYINEIRLEKVKEFLRDPKLKISEAAEMVGYDNVHTFIYFFKENTGMTPGEYRAKAGAESNPLE
jgi:AraC-like DNA-binding protein